MRRAVLFVVGLLAMSACSSSQEPSAGGPTTADVARGPAASPGVTDDEIPIGVVHYAGVSAAAKSTTAGSQASDAGDMRADYQIAIDEVNKRGGVLGRKLVPHFREYDTMAPDGASQEQASCAALTQDRKVFAVLAPNRQSDTFRGCFERAGAAYLGWGGSTSTDEGVFKQFPHYAEAGTLSLTRVAPVVVERLVEKGFLDKSSKLGVVLFDTPASVRAVDEHLKPALAEHGVALAQEMRIPSADTAAQLAEANPAIQSAVLQFRNRGVDRVLFVQNGVGLPYLFMHGANRQNYRPRYVVTSNDGPSSLITQVPATQLEGAQGVGWLPTDSAPAEWKPTHAQQECIDMMRANGQPLQANLAQHAAITICDHVRIFVKALEAGGPRISNNSFMAGLERMGSSLESILTTRLSYGPTRHDGVGAVRDMQFFAECRCFRYTSEATDI